MLLGKVSNLSYVDVNDQQMVFMNLKKDLNTDILNFNTVLSLRLENNLVNGSFVPSFIAIYLAVPGISLSVSR